MRHVTDEERRARLAVRHAIAPGFRVDGPEAATRAVTALHATEPATVFLSCWARVDDLRPADVERALYTDKALVKQLAMRRTLFTFPRDLLPAVWPSASARVAGTERARMAKDLVALGVTDDGHGWLDKACAEVLALLAEHPDGRTAAEIRTAIPMMGVKVAPSATAAWSSSRVLTLLGARADIVRGSNTGTWVSSRPRWTLTANWLGSVPEPLSSADGYRELVGRWLRSFGPGTEDDIVWWLGSTKSAVRAALAALEAVPVSLDGGDTGWLLPDDLAEAPDPGPWVALLPVLDPTTMGWKSRAFYLDGRRDQLFDRNGNAGTTAWVDGRAVGCWTQDASGTVAVQLVEAVSRSARRALDDEAARLTAWAGRRVETVYPSPAVRAATTR
ncbi:winged helix DNA-binding domain-containing protein [Actinokineospora guangxiensis]|uniref:Winged helix DNA-binding domain-containing protein n=1 Tax=Actinokineospora guangxiensis TaxID=1490288 RepID=A0ABW0EQE1_9PSEU